MSKKNKLKTTKIALSDLNDKELMEKVNKKNKEAFEVFYDRFSTNVYSLALRVTKSESFAEETTQETFLAIWRSNSIYQDNKGSVKSWLLQITKNKSLDKLKYNNARPELEEADYEYIATQEKGIHTIAEENQKAQKVKEAIKELPKPQSEVIFKTFYEGKTQSEIAEETGVALGTTKGRMRQALQKLRQSQDIQEVFNNG